jgi:peptidoglycan biosynthesis protein MviN/MurJ (putative lipid II flippase)
MPLSGRFSCMSTQTLAIEADRAALHEEPRTTSTAKARAGMAMSIATFAMAFASACQAVLYLGRFGTNARTDGFFVAFALYSTFGVFSQSLRLTSVPLLVGPSARLSARQFAAAIAAVALPVVIVTGPLAHPLAQLIAPGLAPSGRAVTASALPVLGAAMVLQLWAAGGATLLAIRDRFTVVAGAYISGSAAGLVAFLALMGTTGEQTLGWSMLSMAVVTCTWMTVGVRRSGGLSGAGECLTTLSVARDAGLILARTAVYLAFNVLFVVTLAFGSHSAAGGTTVLSYAYLFASYLIAGTGMALGMSSIPDMTRDASTRGRALVADTVPRGFRYAMMIVAPAMLALITVGAPLVHAILPHSLSAAQVHTLRAFTGLLIPWSVCALLAVFLMPVLFAVGRAGLLNALALPLLLLHLAATALGSMLFGVDGAVGAFFIAPGCFAAILLVAGAGRDQAARLVAELAGDAARFLVLAGLSFGAGWALGSTLPGNIAPALLAGAVGGTLYLAGLRIFARRQLEVMLSAAMARPSAA